MVNLKELTLACNNLTALPGLSSLVNLQKLDLSYNNLTALPGLRALVNLQRFWFYETQIDQVEILQPLVTLIDLQKQRNLQVVEVILGLKEIDEEDLRALLARLSRDGQTQMTQ